MSRVLHRWAPASLLPVLLPFLLLTACGGHLRPLPQPAADDRKPVAEPAPQTVSILADGFHQQIAEPLHRHLQPSRALRRLTGRSHQAANATALDEVDDSAWFVNRNHLYPMTPDQVALGPNTNGGPDTTGVWRVTSAKVEGVTPGFTIRDVRGDRYVIKLDAAGHRELNSAAEIISTKLLYAAGYHVPENHVTWFDPARLELGDKVTFTDTEGNKRAMTGQDLAAILAGVEIGPDGRVRAVASRFLKGKILGPFRYEGVRVDDGNDVIPHQHRRELRGLQVVAAWLNHYDTKANNSLDVFVADGYVRHYLLDFGSTLGSQGDEAMPTWVGHENEMDVKQMAVNALTLGLLPRPWERAAPMHSAAVGYFEAELFHPERYESIFPNPAFAEMTERDGFWGARLVMSFTDAQIDAAVAAGLYSDPADADYVAQVLKARRDRIGSYWFGRMTPLDHFVVAADELQSTDLLALSGHSRAGSDYRVRIHPTDSTAHGSWRDLVPQAPGRVHVALPPSGGRYCVELQARQGRRWLRPVKIVIDGPVNTRSIVQIDR